MTAILEYETEDGVIAIEVEEPVTAGKFKPAADKDAARHVLLATETFDQALSRVKTVANAFARTLQDVDLEFPTASVAIGLKFTADAGIVFAKAGAEAQMTLTLTWKQEHNRTS